MASMTSTEGLSEPSSLRTEGHPSTEATSEYLSETSLEKLDIEDTEVALLNLF